MEAPGKFNIPRSHLPETIRDYEEYSILVLDYLNPRGNIRVETEAGYLDVKTPQDFFNLFSSRWNFTHSYDEELTSLFKVFKRDQLIEAWLYGDFNYDRYKVFWRPGLGKVRIQEGNNTRSSRYLVDLSSFGPNHQHITTLDDLERMREEFILLHQYVPMSPTSAGSTMESFILGLSKEEFYICNDMPLKWVGFLHDGYIGPRQEGLTLGSAEEQDQDEIKSYLRELGRTPGTSSILKVIKGRTYYPEAHPGSVYEVEVIVPETYNQFPPLPKRTLNQGTIYPTGRFQTRVPKPYIDLAYELGDIKVKILDSIQGVMKTPPNYPWAEASRALELLEDSLTLDFIDKKSFHYTILGHMRHIHKKYERNHERSYETSRDYNPWIINGATANVAVRQWKKANVTNGTRIRVDCISGRNLPEDSNCTTSSSGLITALTSHFRDKPGETFYRDMIEKNRDFRGVWFEFEYRVGLREANFTPSRIGHLKKMKWMLPPLGGSRDFNFDKRVGELLLREFPTTIPTLRDEIAGDSEFWRIYSILKTKI